MSHIAILPVSIRARWDRLAVSQLCAALLSQQDEIERLQRADSDADYWQNQAMSMQDIIASEHDLEPALTQGGQLTFISSAPASPSSSSPPMRTAQADNSPQRLCGMWPPSSDTDGGTLELDNETAAKALTGNEVY